MLIEGQYFYFFSWVCWIVVMFFFPKTKLRFLLSVLLLGIIAGSSSFYFIGNFEVSIAYLILAVSGIIMLVQTLKKQYLLHYFSICTVSLAYVCFKLFEIYDPVWIIFDRKWMLSAIMLFLSLLLFKTNEHRYVFLLVSLLLGELLKTFIFYDIFAYSVIGSFEFLDVLGITIAGLSTWIIFEMITVYLDSIIQRRVKEKQG